MARKPGPGEASGYFAALAGANYVQLTTFRRGGRAVATPVHIVTAGDVAFFRTWDVAGKAKRLRHTSAVRVAPSTFAGGRAGRQSGPRLTCWRARPRSGPPAR